MNYAISNTHFTQRTVDARRINKTLVADFTFDSFKDQHRHKIFLPRNMTKVLAFHDRNRALDDETGSGRPYLLRRRGPFLGSRDLTSKAAIRENRVDDATVSDDSRQTIETATNHGSVAPQIKPDLETMSPACLKVKASRDMMDEGQKERRRSVRNRMARQHEDKNANLYLNLTNIRKKLNFKESVSDGDDRPRKRTKREKVTCHCHITIWDNREGLDQREPIIRKSELCDVTTSDMGGAGYSAEIQLQSPFIFKSSELRVPLSTPSGTSLGIGDKYFLEIKIIPTRPDVDWPPVPILGRSEGDQSTALGRMAAEKLQGALVARYMHLPQAPAPDVPLSVFFLHEGRTYRSKYGLETNAIWRIGDVSSPKIKNEEDDMRLNLWNMDDKAYSSDRRESMRTRSSRAEPDPETQTKRSQITPQAIRVTYNIDAASAKGAKEFRKCTLKGLKCPACPAQVHTSIDELQFHFLTCHSNYKFVVEKEDFDPVNDDLTAIAFKIMTPNATKSRVQDRELRSRDRERDRDLNWQAPAEALDVSAFVNGDRHWVSENWIEGQPKKAEPNVSVPVAVPDKLSRVRQEQRGGYAPAQKGGFLSAEYVSDFRKPERKKFPAVKLHTMTIDKDTMYTSISHRKIPVDDDARSESDDEIDDSWFVQKSLEALDIAAEKQNWSNEQRLLRRKWNKLRLDEKLSHPRYLSDGLIRFTRSQRPWLLDGGSERTSAFSELLDELLQRRVINQEVIRDVWMILYDKKTETTSDNIETTGEFDNAIRRERPKDEISDLPRQLTRQEQAEIWLKLPPYSCIVCMKSVEEMGRRGVRCSEHECEAPAAWYHTRCVRCRRRDRLHWKCQLCEQRLEEAAVSKDQGAVELR